MIVSLIIIFGLLLVLITFMVCVAAGWIKDVSIEKELNQTIRLYNRAFGREQTAQFLRSVHGVPLRVVNKAMKERLRLNNPLP